MKKRSLILPVALLLSACGGSDSNTDSSPLPAIIEGELTALNTTTGAATVGRYHVNLSPVTQTRNAVESLDNLALGMVLTLRTDGQQTITSMHYDDLLKAPVTAYDSEAQTLTMAGKLVQYNGARLATGLLIDSSIIGKTLQISGFNVDQNTIQATFIKQDQQASATDVEGEVEGVVTNLNANERSFNIGSLLVDYSGARAPASLQNGQWVEVEGRFSDNTLVATEVELESYDYDKGSQIELEGHVTQVNSDSTTGLASSLILNGSRLITLGGNVKYDDFPRSNGAPVIQTGMFIEVEGQWQDNAIAASELECEKNCNLSTGSGSSQPNTGSRDFEVEGYAEYDSNSNTISLNGFAFVVAERAEWDDISAQTWNGLEWVSLSGKMDSYSHIAWEIEGEDRPEDDMDLKGLVTMDDSGVYALWGYAATDNSLSNIVQKWGNYVDVECDFTYNRTTQIGTLSNCQYDD